MSVDKNGFWEALCAPDRRPFAVELDAPDSPDLTKYMAGARRLADAGAELVTVADCPNGRPCVDSSLTACKLHRELGIQAMPHLTCRDRNRNASRALLLGGVMPVVSRKNARFMNENIPGIDVDGRVEALYEGADRARGEDLAVEVSAAVAREIAPYIDGFYLMTPFGRTELMARIMDRLRKEGLQ